MGARLISDVVERHALQARRKKRFCIGAEVAHASVDRANDRALHIARIAFRADEEAFAHGGVNGVEADLGGRAEQPPATVMALCGANEPCFAQLAQHAPHHDGIGHEALRQGGGCHGHIRLLVEVHQGMKGKGKAA